MKSQHLSLRGEQEVGDEVGEVGRGRSRGGPRGLSDTRGLGYPNSTTYEYT